MNKLVALTAAAAAVGFIGSASAADLPTKAPMAPAPMVAPAFNWTGCYIGGNIGGVFGRSNENIPLYPATFDINMSSVIGGGHIGCNYTFAPHWVVGLEGDFDWTDLKGDELTTGSGGERYFQRWNWTASARGRLGYAWDNWLLYVTGGAAWANLDSAFFSSTIGTSTSVSATHLGWTVGGGVEYGLTPNWIIGAEYLFAHYERKTYVCSACGPVDFDLETHTVRARLSYKFF